MQLFNFLSVYLYRIIKLFKKMNFKIIIIFFSPILLLLEMMIIGWIADLLRQSSDIAVLMGVISICFWLVGNFYLLKIIVKQFKQKTK